MNHIVSENSNLEKKKKHLPRLVEFLIVILIICVLLLLLYPAVQQAREIAKYKSPSRRHLKYLGLAISNFDYVQTENSSWERPVDSSGAPLHSWMTDLLPYIDESAMAAEIDYSQAWDTSENKNVFTITIPKFFNPDLSDVPHQNVQGYGLSHYSANSHLIPFNKTRNLTTVKMHDGQSNTLLIGEIDSSFPAWGDPTNLRDPIRGLKGGPNAYGRPGGEGVFFLFADGSVHLLNKDTDPAVLKALSTPAGGETFPLQQAR
ncbi:DUF1559 family PulG-like putative transporter [Gimesia maris]|uniref:DUF1559 domain-containing protein n=1 Tax=Gimesia maris TaxID=122 RepID=A0ABX5YTF1_9PLAN|nr:DUF1559 domain-containing protein [Gimesia maris]EDL57053.1 hypothetical protein PM8797T_19577 [Gimesia maris DSM 8797]QDU16840.1 hypothetical protein CA11_46760 [Gimesia maris]QEG18885.1 hypothetical protein GmarT_47790 [Gimesia maris]QGQ28205.1 DUF1559 domain-containing protein [Gimesia maris]